MEINFGVEYSINPTNNLAVLPFFIIDLYFLCRLQEARLEVLQKILREREENHTELNTKRLDKLWTKKQKEREKKVNWIRNEHIKCKQ